MSTLHIYDMSVPLFTRQLLNLSAILKKSQQWCADNGKPDSYLLEASLAPDMRKLPFQICVASNMARSGLPGPNWKWVPSATDPMPEQDFASLQKRLQDTLDVLAAVKREDLEGGAAMAGSIWPSGHTGKGPEFKFGSGVSMLTEFLIPNMFFHITTAYDICRSKGVPLGKTDFIAGCGLPFS